MALRSTQRVTEENARNLSGMKGHPTRKADLTAIYDHIVYEIWNP
jgi:hypothetical protein